MAAWGRRRNSAIGQTAGDCAAITLVGPVAALREQIAWLETRPLYGRTVAVTRARAQASALAVRLRDLGAEELGAKERDLTDQLFRMRIQKSMGQLEAPDKMRTVRRDLARIKTVQRQKRVAG